MVNPLPEQVHNGLLKELITFPNVVTAGKKFNYFPGRNVTKGKNFDRV